MSGSIVALVLKVFLDRKIEKHRFTRDWKEQALSKVAGPVLMHLKRTAEVAAQYQTSHREKTKSYFHAKIMRDSNEMVRSILLSNGHLVPEELRAHAHALVAHYDVWLRLFDAKVALENPGADATFDVGFAEVRFPRAAQQAFEAFYEELREELYDVKTA